jgi:glycosyltransferase involved in cell wall biosynthesis
MSGYSVRTFGFRGTWGQIQRIEEGLRRIGCHIAAPAEAFDFIYSNELLQGGEAIACKATSGRPLIRHIHDLPAYEGTPAAKSLHELRLHREAVLASADLVTTNTHFVAAQLERFWGYRGALVIGQPMQFDPDLEGFRTRRRRRLAVIVGRLADPMKNTALALDALSLMRRPPDLAMVWVGKAKRKPRSWFRRYRIEHHIEIPASALASLIKQARMLLAPSFFEGLGLPPIEALAAGTPAIVSDIPVKREVFAGTPMRFHDPHDPADLAQAIEALLADEESGWQLVEAFRPKIPDYTVEGVATKIVAAFETLTR